MAITHGYRGDFLSQEVREAHPEIPWVIRGEKGGSLSKGDMLRRGLQLMTAGIGKGNGRQYMGEFWLRVLQESMKEDAASHWAAREFPQHSKHSSRLEACH
jgi:hypothetical protein